MDTKSSNSLFFKGLCLVAPAVALVAAHYFPWRAVRGRELHQLEAYVVGTSAIVGTAGFAISLSDGDKEDHVTMLGLATVSAGLTTFAAHAVDEFIKGRAKANEQEAKIAGLKAQIEALKQHGTDI